MASTGTSASPADKQVADFRECASLEQEANCCSKFLFVWLDGIVWQGYKRPLQHTDLGKLHYDYDKAGWLGDHFQASIDQAKAEGKNMWTVLARTRSSAMLWAIFVKLLGDTLGYVPFIGLAFVSDYLQVSHVTRCSTSARAPSRAMLRLERHNAP